ncbi:MAG: mercuric transporter MerT family protein [Candidatus Scalindua sp.]|nr:mercuric transporter MerT family protein [Candidatus Scalindua sp.]MCR4343485.1 mercuric transporter MerT family protein [Candidatus Scalindua sp.]
MKSKSVTTLSGTIAAAILASSCCLGPLILVRLGMGSIGIFLSLEKYRPLFMIITFAFIGMAFYLTYRKKKGDDCCEIKQVKMDRIKKISLWVIAAVAVGLMLFPYVYGHFGRSDSATPMSDDLQQVVIKVEGMTCEACTISINSAFSKIQGVSAVNVSLEKGEAIVGFDNNVKDIPTNRLLTAIEDIGYKPSLVTKK